MNFKHKPKPDATELFETTQVWKGSYDVRRVTEKCHACGHTRRVTQRRPQYPGKWVCKHCGADTITKHIATGHDHSDYHYDTCGCDGARKTGRPSKELT